MTESPEDAALRLARKAAKNVHCSVIEVLKRPKSQAYLLGQLHKLFPSHGGMELKQIVQQLRWREADNPESKEPERPSRRRKPPKGREPSTSDKWVERVAQLSALILQPVTTSELEQMAQNQLGMDHNLFSQVLAAAEHQGAIQYDSTENTWQPLDPAPEEIPEDPNAAAKEIELECQLDTEERLDALSEAAELKDTEEHINAQIRELRAELRETRKRLGECLRRVHVGSVVRTVRCEMRKDFKRGQVLTIRLDTFEVVERRTMTGSDRQLQIGA